MTENTVFRPESKRRREAGIAYGLAVRIYEPRPYPGRIVIIANEEWCKAADPTFGWTASGGVEVFSIPGNHNTYMRNQSKMVADVLKACLTNFETDSTRRKTGAA